TVTASTSNPSADQMETLIVETPIPTVSSPVLTTYSTDSQEPSSDARLISKRVANQVETPSLDNILSLTNRFEDILGEQVQRGGRIELYCHNPSEDRSSSSSVLSMVRPIGKKWVLKNKKDERGIVIKNKARLVAQGYTQEEVIDYDEVFAPITRIEAIILFLAYALFMGFTVYQMDVKSAFLYGTIDEEAPRAWYGTLSKYLLKNGFQRGTIDQTLFIKRQRGDFILVQKEDGIFLSQDKYVGDILKKFRYLDVKSSNTPMDKENPWGKDGTGKDVDLHLYRSMIRSLMYLTTSRPEIMFAVCACARHQVTPKESYSDSDYGGATQDRKSTTGGCQILGRWLISWQCKKQTIVATSKTKAEYVAAASCCGQVL
nr:hypothetical protein [Tanacetum cinerariifolium]